MYSLVIVSMVVFQCRVVFSSPSSVIDLAMRVGGTHLKFHDKKGADNPFIDSYKHLADLGKGNLDDYISEFGRCWRDDRLLGTSILKCGLFAWLNSLTEFLRFGDPGRFGDTWDRRRNLSLVWLLDAENRP